MIVVPFGCPRAGTTYLSAVLEVACPNTFKLAEWSDLHPCRSNEGFIKLGQLFGKSLLLVRIKRHPMEIVKSFIFARTIAKDHDTAHGIASNTDAQIVRFITSESRNFHHQISLMGKWPWNGWPFNYCEIRYEDLAKKPDILPLSHLPYIQIQSASLWNQINFGKNPVRDGRLARSGNDFDIGYEQDRRFRESLKGVIKHEGY